MREIRPSELKGYAQLHFFAGVGGWAYALQLAGWPSHRPVWTGSCPCQPFSSAGKREGFTDERHLWPAWFHLVQSLQPPVIFGEQVASKAGYLWLDLVQTDLEAEGYAVGAADLPAAGVGAPHIRQRLWFVAYSPRSRLEVGAGSQIHPSETLERPERLCDAGRVEDSLGVGRGRRLYGCHTGESREVIPENQVEGSSTAGELAHSDTERPQRRAVLPQCTDKLPVRQGSLEGFWANVEWLPCRDGKWRPVEPSLFPLANRIPARVGRLRAYGNAVVPQVAAKFIQACMEL